MEGVAEERLAEVMTRTDAAVGLLLRILIAKGVVTKTEIVSALDAASTSGDLTGKSQILNSIFWSLRTLIEAESPALH